MRDIGLSEFCSGGRKAMILCQAELLLALQRNLFLGAMDRGKLSLAAADRTIAEATGAGLAQDAAPLHATREAVQKGIPLLTFFFAYFNSHDLSYAPAAGATPAGAASAVFFFIFTGIEAAFTAPSFTRRLWAVTVGRAPTPIQ